MRIIREETDECLNVDLNKNDIKIFDGDNETKLNLTNESIVGMSIKSDDTWYALKQISNFSKNKEAKE